MKLHVYPVSELTHAVATCVSQLSNQAIETRNNFSVAISGGSLPKLLFPPLTVSPLSETVDWNNWHVFWADERCVPKHDPESNYLLARTYLFDHVKIPQTHIYSPDTALNPEDMAHTYQNTLQSYFHASSGIFPIFDLIMLGMGEDGHTASLFPNHALLHEKNRWIAPIYDSPKPPPGRITMTLPVINNARHVLFLITGVGKAHTLRKIFSGNTNPYAVPAKMIQLSDGELHWFLDEAAASELEK
ncbi:MAG: 6-phosphogluconolactonase [Candidatus Brocadiaceae bacterium]|nr:6-phosphogluconolactonase [Candidatus Brocadiaceae bacterium]